jgi:hypothetical protein
MLKHVALIGFLAALSVVDLPGSAAAGWDGGCYDGGCGGYYRYGGCGRCGYNYGGYYRGCGGCGGYVRDGGYGGYGGYSCDWCGGYIRYGGCGCGDYGGYGYRYGYRYSYSYDYAGYGW